MPFYRAGALYSRWDGTQKIGPLDADEVMKALSDDLLQSGDLDLAMQRLFRWGFERQDGERVPGLREMMSRLKERRRDQLERYDLGSMIDKVREQLREVMETERAGIERRLDEGRQRLNQSRDSESDADDKTAAIESASASDSGEVGGAQPDGDGSGDVYDEDLHRLLEQLAAKKLDQLGQVPQDPAGAINALHEYEFMTPEAHQRFQELLLMLQQQMLQSTFQGMEQALSNTSPEDIADMNRMLSDLNDMLEARQRGEPVDFDQFKHKWGHYFGNDVEDLDQLVERMSRQTQAMQQLMESMSPDQRRQLEGMMEAILGDQGLQQQMSRLSDNLGHMTSPSDWRRRFQFSGDESLTLTEALRLMNRLNDYDELERDLRDVKNWNDLANIDDEKFQDLLGEESSDQLDQLRRLAEVLEDAGYIRQGANGFELTPQGVRKIGEKALTDIFLHLKRDRVGQHEQRHTGGGGERTDQSKPYEFGDPFLLDLPKTVMNAVQRDGVGSPVRLSPQDFEVYRTELSTRSATVLMVDMSRSMLYNGCFNAAKKVSLALDSLIRTKYPRDAMSIIGFSSVARELKPTDLPTLDWNEYNYGTNMQHGFMLARQILNRHKGANRQVIVITDGEPTAHFDEGGKVRFAYPPQPRTFRETLKEVVRCTRDGITINTFMLERSPYMVQFINDLMKINNGRVFVATPDRLGEYILVDYVANKRKWIG